MESKFYDPSNNVKNPLKFRNSSTFRNDNDFFTQIYNYNFKRKENEFYEKKFHLLEDNMNSG